MAKWIISDILKAHNLLEIEWNCGGWLHERPSNVRRGQRTGHIGESSDIQISRIRTKRPKIFTMEEWYDLSWKTLSPNAREIYMNAARQLELPISHLDAECAWYRDGDEICDSMPTCSDCYVRYEEAEFAA